MKYVHTNIISKDWKTLASFYIQVFDCKMILPQRNLSGDWLSKGTGLKNAQLKGAHLRLPGYGKNGPTLEIFEYTQLEESPNALSNRKGLGHLAFEVDSVKEVMDKAIEFGAQAYGEIVQHNMEQLGTLTFVYIKDPEGNIIELQNWGKTIDYVNSNESSQTNNSNKEQEHITTEELVIVDNKSANDNREKISIEINLPKENPPTVIINNNLNNDPNIGKSKQELLDELKRDLDATKQGIEDARNELRYGREDAKYTMDKARRDNHNLDSELIQPKTKEQLLEDLKREMMFSDDKIELNINNNLQPINKEETPVPKEIKLQKIITSPAVLTIEIKTNTGISTMDLTKIKLNMDLATLAKNLRSLTNLTRPEAHDLLFIEFIGQAFKADTVPLLQQSKTNNSSEENENAWTILPRIQGSLQHLLDKSAQEPEVLIDAKLNSIGLSPKDFVNSYQELLTLVSEAETLGASHLRLSYS